VIGYFVVIKKDKFLRMAINNLILLMTLATLLNMVIVVLAHLYFKNTESKLKSLKEESLIDPLTKLFNRRGFFEKISDDKEYSIIFADIDFFKKINDTYGHDVGDKILKEVASILKKHIRKGDLIARWGGEEFLIYLPFTSKKEGITIANKLRDVIKASDISPKITLSFGIAHSSEGDSLEEILKIADERLYKAKELGRDKVIGD
jgi:diguanylate cyclase (GGDEF)-like protein